MKQTKKRVVAFVGGETAGPIIPLIAVGEEWVKADSTITPIFIDKRKSVAAHVVPRAGFKFHSMSAGKLRRYWSFRNLFSPVLILVGIVRSILLFASYRPAVVVGAGGYVQVPVMIAAWILRIPRLIHQQDIVPTFSNRLIAIIASKITVTFEKSLKDFSQGTGFEKKVGTNSKIYWTGNPSRLDKNFVDSSQAKKEAMDVFNLQDDYPVIFVLGGGSGAAGLNNVIYQNLSGLTKVAQIIHSSGQGKMFKPAINETKIHDRYRQYEFVDRADLAYAAADLVIARAGISTITELAKLGKAAIIIPMPNSHQESNARYLYDHGAAIVADQSDLGGENLTKVVKKIFFDAKLQNDLQKNISKLMPLDSTQRMLSQIQDLIHDR